MSRVSTHHPEVIDEMNARAALEEPYTPSASDWAEYRAYLDSLPADDYPQPEDLGDVA